MNRERYERDQIMADLGYYHIEDIQSSAVDLALRYHSIEELSSLLYAFAYGSSFMHANAYRLCSIANCWPAFVKHPKNTDYVVDFEKMISAVGDATLHQQFQDAFIQNRTYDKGEVAPFQRSFRIKVCKAAAEALKIDWKEIKKNR